MNFCLAEKQIRNGMNMTRTDWEDRERIVYFDGQTLRVDSVNKNRTRHSRVYIPNCEDKQARDWEIVRR